MKMLVNSQGKALVVGGNALVMEDDNVIYRLTNYTCDGTAATCIDTGIKLFSQAFIQQHPKFQIEISFAGDSSAATKKAHVIRCCRATKPYSGTYIRIDDSNSTRYRIYWKTASSGNDYLNYTPSNQYIINDLVIAFDFTNSTATVINRNQKGSIESNRFTRDNLFEDVPFTIGGSVINGVDSSGGWKEMWTGTITSLIIKDVE